MLTIKFSLLVVLLCFLTPTSCDVKMNGTQFLSTLKYSAYNLNFNYKPKNASQGIEFQMKMIVFFITYVLMVNSRASDAKKMI